MLPPPTATPGVYLFIEHPKSHGQGHISKVKGHRASEILKSGEEDYSLDVLALVAAIEQLTDEVRQVTAPFHRSRCQQPFFQLL